MVTGVLLDIDGVLAVSWKPLPGAAETLGWLRGRRIPFRLVTNTSSRSRRRRPGRNREHDRGDQGSLAQR